MVDKSYAKAFSTVDIIQLSDGRKVEIREVTGSQFNALMLGMHQEFARLSPPPSETTQGMMFINGLVSFMLQMSTEDFVDLPATDTIKAYRACMPHLKPLLMQMGMPDVSIEALETGFLFGSGEPKDTDTKIKVEGTTVKKPDKGWEVSIPADAQELADALGSFASPMIYTSTKTFGHSVGLSAAFRQWRAESHCRFIHGYSLQVHFEFTTTELDARNWVVDFGSLKSLKGLLEDTFDHKTIVAEDDPELATFKELDKKGLIQLRVLPDVGCEKFAEYLFEVTEIWLKDNGYAPRVHLRKVQVSEHEGNSAIAERNPLYG